MGKTRLCAGESRSRTITPHRDPETGQFVSGDSHDFDEIVQQFATAHLQVPAADVGGQTGTSFGQAAAVEGVEMFDMENLLDRFDLGAILWANYQLDVYITSTQTADGTVRAEVELSTSPSRQVAETVQTSSDAGDTSGDFTIEIDDQFPFASDTDDVLGPPLMAVGYGPITDGTNGVGGAGTAGRADWEGPIMVEPVLDDRDSVFLNAIMEHSNVSDAALHADVRAHYTVGILEE